jgi:hypothetical protein
MKQSRHRTRNWLIAAGSMVLTSSLFMPGARAADDAVQILKAMSDYVTSQKNISLTFDSDVEVITPEVEKIQFASSGKMSLSRPDKLRVTRTGGYADVEIVFDGKTVSALGKNINSFTQMDERPLGARRRFSGKPCLRRTDGWRHQRQTHRSRCDRRDGV